MQFKLKTILVCIFVVGIVLVPVSRYFRWKDQRTRELQKAMLEGWQLEGFSDVTAAFWRHHPSYSSSLSLRPILPFANSLRSIEIEGSSSSRDLSDLASFQKLQSLSITFTNADEKMLREIGGIRCLTKLNLRQTNTSDCTCKHIANLDGLRSVCLAETKITDAGAAHLSRLHNLQFVDISRTHISDAGLLTLMANNPELHTLRVSGTNITADGLRIADEKTTIQRIEAFNLGFTRKEAATQGISLSFKVSMD